MQAGTGTSSSAGWTGVGLRIVEQLTLSGVPAVVVDDDPDPPLARIIRRLGRAADRRADPRPRRR